MMKLGRLENQKVWIGVRRLVQQLGGYEKNNYHDVISTLALLKVFQRAKVKVIDSIQSTRYLLQDLS